MKRLDFSDKQGWPLSTDTLEFMQAGTEQVQQAALLGGNNYILSGCAENGTNVSAGWVVIGGEVLPFAAGNKQTNVIIVDTATQREFFGGDLKNYYHERVAMFGTGSVQYPWVAFKRNDPANGVLARLEKIEKMLKPLMGYTSGGTTVYGSWLFWGRPASEIPAGWEPVPDSEWKGRVPIVLNESDPDFNEVGKQGGEKQHFLTKNEMPAVSTTVKISNRGWPKDSGDRANNGGHLVHDIINTGDSFKTFSSDPIGGGQAHNNVQPYRVVMFIRFVG